MPKITSKDFKTGDIAYRVKETQRTIEILEVEVSSVGKNM